MRYMLKLDIVYGPFNLRDAVAQLMFARRPHVHPGLIWRETGVRSAGDTTGVNGWPEVEFIGTAGDLMTIARNYADDMDDDGTSLLEIIKSIEPYVEEDAVTDVIDEVSRYNRDREFRDQDLTDDYVATEGRELRPGGRDFHL